MSILLEALRKSENSQKPVEPPTIHGNDHQLREPESIKSSYVILLIIITLFVIGWFLWQQYYAEEPGYSPPVELPARRTTGNVPEVPGTTKSSPAESSPAKSALSKAKGTAALNAASQTAANTTRGRPRTPVESYRPSDEERAVISKERREMAVAVAKAKGDAARDKPGNRPAEPANIKPATAQAGKAGFGQSATTKDKNQAAARANSSNASTQEYQSPEPEPIGYWELPDSVRNGVSEIKFSVLVYADDPANRFVLINGDRLIEGEELKPGVVVEHIRRDGVVFSYQLYKFFVKR